LNKLDQAREQVFYAETTADLATLRQDATSSRERLIRLLGLWDGDIGIRLPQKLPVLPRQPRSLPRIEVDAVEHRIDLQIARIELGALAKSLNLTELLIHRGPLMIDLGLIVARFLHYVAVTTLAGASFFPLYAHPRGFGSQPIALARRMRMVLFIAANVALVSGILWFVFTVANMSGTLDGVLDQEMLFSVLGDTSFGNVWIARLVLSIATIIVICNRFDSRSSLRRDAIAPALAAALLISLAGVGHSQVEEGIAGMVHVVSDAAHLLAAGAWLGGLVPLALILVAYDRDREITREEDLGQVLLRFSGMGYVAVATLVGSGLVNSWYLVGTVVGLLTTQYGQLLLAKLALFAGMLLLAVTNRFWIVPSMSKARAGDGTSSVWTGRLRAHVAGEQLLGLMVLAIVSVLGPIRPAIGQ
jgi:putative copper resistance protein D